MHLTGVLRNSGGAPEFAAILVQKAIASSGLYPAIAIKVNPI
jgi:hypothetical protein